MLRHSLPLLLLLPGCWAAGCGGGATAVQRAEVERVLVRLDYREAACSRLAQQMSDAWLIADARAGDPAQSAYPTAAASDLELTRAYARDSERPQRLRSQVNAIRLYLKPPGFQALLDLYSAGERLCGLVARPSARSNARAFDRERREIDSEYEELRRALGHFLPFAAGERRKIAEELELEELDLVDE